MTAEGQGLHKKEREGKVRVNQAGAPAVIVKVNKIIRWFKQVELIKPIKLEFKI
jgi:hypothetical protein